MSRSAFSNFRPSFGSAVLLAVILAIGGALAAWKYSAIRKANAATANQPEPMEVVTAAVAEAKEHRDTKSSIGTVLALRSVELKNEVPGTVRRMALTPGDIVPAGTVLVALDVSVEEADLKAQEAQAALTETALARVQRLMEDKAAPQAELDRAVAQRDVAVAQIARIKAVIDRKTLRAPFRARVGIADIHPGQYLAEGTLITTLQSVESSANVDFTVAQRVAAVLREGEVVDVFVNNDAPPVRARIMAIDSRVDPVTRNATVRAKTVGHGPVPSPGASVRVVVPVGPPRKVVVVPASALRKGPGGDHVFVIAPDKTGKPRVQSRAVQGGPVLRDQVVVLSGLKPGEQVAASGSFKLRDGVLVTLAGDSAGPSASK